MTRCEQEGMSGNCGIYCRAFLAGECGNMETLVGTEKDYEGYIGNLHCDRQSCKNRAAYHSHKYTAWWCLECYEALVEKRI